MVANNTARTAHFGDNRMIYTVNVEAALNDGDCFQEMPKLIEAWRTQLI
jgi:hypothetical protein